MSRLLILTVQVADERVDECEGRYHALHHLGRTLLQEPERQQLIDVQVALATVHLWPEVGACAACGQHHEGACLEGQG